MKIEELTLSTRSYNALKWAGIETVERLCEITESDLLKFRNFGKKSITEINNELLRHGKHLLGKAPLSPKDILVLLYQSYDRLTESMQSMHKQIRELRDFTRKVERLIKKENSNKNES